MHVPEEGHTRYAEGSEYFISESRLYRALVQQQRLSSIASCHRRAEERRAQEALEERWKGGTGRGGIWREGEGKGRGGK